MAVVSLANTASGQISDRFNALMATSVTAHDAREDPSDAFPITRDVEQRVRQINGVLSAGAVWHVGADRFTVAGAPTVGRSKNIDVFAVSASAWAVVDPKVAAGRTYDEFAERTEQRVVVLGASVARKLGIATLATQPTISIDRVPFTVVGIIDDVRRNPEILLSIAVPQMTAYNLWGAPLPAKQASIVVETEVGAAQQVSSELRYAVQPAAPDSLSVTPPPDPRQLRG